MRWRWTLALLVASCAASPARPVVEADPLPGDVTPLPPPRAYTCACAAGLVCCEDACATCVQAGAPCPAVACRR